MVIDVTARQAYLQEAGLMLETLQPASLVFAVVQVAPAQHVVVVVPVTTWQVAALLAQLAAVVPAAVNVQLVVSPAVQVVVPSLQQ
jgi:ketopantoate reductase